MMRWKQIIEAEILAFKPKKRVRRHLVDVIKIAGPRSHPWSVWVNGQHFNSFRTEAQAEDVAIKKEAEFDDLYDKAGIRLQIMSFGREFALLDRGVSIGVFPNYQSAEARAKEIEPGSTARMIRAWYRELS